MIDLCQYCQERPVFEHFTSACYKCSFTCMRCEELTGYDAGMAYDELCDDCGVAVGSTPEKPFTREQQEGYLQLAKAILRRNI